MQESSCMIDIALCEQRDVKKMHGHCLRFMLIYVVALAIPVSLAFNINETDPTVYRGEKEDFFGYKVLQFKSAPNNKGIIVTAPLQRNGSGGVCKPSHQKPPQCFNHNDEKMPVRYLGLSIAADSNKQFTVCSPHVVNECQENSYLSGLCYKMTDQLQTVSLSKPGYQECTKKTVDLVFLFDGSGSMTEDEFNKNKDFILDIMKSLNGSSIKFAAVQFSTEYRKVFDFNDYAAGRSTDKLKNEQHMRSLTNTHRALKFVLEEILESPAAGASPDATKVVVLITDGDPSDTNRLKIIERYDEKNIIRFVIGVKDANLAKFRAIASEPKDQNAFKIDNYNGLTGILDNFQKRIFKIEGSKVSRAGELTNELSQSGFSAVYYKDTLILGSVGSNSWRGSLQEIHGNKQSQIEDPQMQIDSYMGYVASVGEKNNTPVYFAGAPRFEHTGQVVVFTHDGKNWTVVQKITGEQIGSYFGAELCSLDVNSDEATDFLLVGAPLFYHAQEKSEGRIYVYTLTDEVQLELKLHVNAPSIGRFGTSMSSLTDLNGDGLQDVAVGAPLEDDNRGAVYIFLGDEHHGIRSTFSQRILGRNIDHSFRFFGQDIDGGIDLGEDGLPDIVVGSQGNVVVLRSRPVVNVTAHLSFEPEEISTDEIDCLSNTHENLPMATLTVCFKMVDTVKSGAWRSGLTITYMLDVDPMRQVYRGFFSQTDRKARSITAELELLDEDTCFNHSIYMPKCVKDTLSPVSIKLNFTQEDSEISSAILNVDSKRQADVEIPFKKQCRQNDTCIADLEVDLDFTTPTLLVAEDSYFNLFIKLSNHGDDSFETRLSIFYPLGLSFSRMTVTEATRPTLHSCEDLDGVFDRTICGVSLPVYRSRSAATFKTSFHIMTDYDWNDTVSINIVGKSDNSNSTGNSSLTKSIPVQHQIKMAITVIEDSVAYLNFTPEDATFKKMVTVFRIDNPGFKAFPVNVSLFFPTTLEHNLEIQNYRVVVKQNKTECTSIADMKSKHCPPENHCKIITCDGFILEKESATEFHLTVDVRFRDLQQQAENIAFLKRYTGDGSEVEFRSFIDINYDKQRYVLDSYKQEVSSESDTTKKSAGVRVEFIIPPNRLVIILTGAVLGFLLLVIIAVVMWKCGCFKRKIVEFEEQCSLKAATSTQSIPTDKNT
ncbi:uncharacterized protein V6R79_026459 [Siganus canaliculatus]